MECVAQPLRCRRARLGAFVLVINNGGVGGEGQKGTVSLWGRLEGDMGEGVWNIMLWHAAPSSGVYAYPNCSCKCLLLAARGPRKRASTSTPRQSVCSLSQVDPVLNGHNQGRIAWSGGGGVLPNFTGRVIQADSDSGSRGTTQPGNSSCSVMMIIMASAATPPGVAN